MELYISLRERMIALTPHREDMKRDVNKVMIDSAFDEFLAHMHSRDDASLMVYTIRVRVVCDFNRHVDVPRDRDVRVHTSHRSGKPCGRQSGGSTQAKAPRNGSLSAPNLRCLELRLSLIGVGFTCSGVG